MTCSSTLLLPARCTAWWNAASPSIPSPSEAISASIATSAERIAARSSSVRRAAPRSSGGRPRPPQFREPHLEELARLQHLGEPTPALHELVQHAAEPAAAAEEDTPSVTHLDEPLGFEHRERLAQGGAADLEPRRQLALGREPLADGEGGSDHEFAQALDEILVQTRAAQRTERRRVDGHDRIIVRN